MIRYNVVYFVSYGYVMDPNKHAGTNTTAATVVMQTAKDDQTFMSKSRSKARTRLHTHVVTITKQLSSHRSVD